MQIKPKGGTICIQSGGAAAANHNERMQGIRDTLSGVKSAESPGVRLTGQNGWKEPDGCPLYTDDDFARANQQMEDILAKYPNLDAFTPTGGFPQFLPDAYERIASKYKDKIASGQLALVVADTLPIQIDAMKKGLSAGQVGQRPFEMGYKAMYFLKDMKDGKAPPGRPDLHRSRRVHAKELLTPASAAEADLAGESLRNRRGPASRRPSCETQPWPVRPSPRSIRRRSNAQSPAAAEK